MTITHLVRESYPDKTGVTFYTYCGLKGTQHELVLSKKTEDANCPTCLIVLDKLKCPFCNEWKFIPTKGFTARYQLLRHIIVKHGEETK
jgi:hypothetical protein